MHGPTIDLDDDELRPYGIHRIPVPVPFAEAGGPVNVYVIEDVDERFALFDTGIGTPEGVAALRGQAAEKKIDLRKLSRIIISHGHVDHFGNAQVLGEESGAPIFIHPADRSKVVGEARVATLLKKHFDFFLSLGVPPLVLQGMLEHAEQTPDQVRYVDRQRLHALNDNEVLQFRHFAATVRHLPGHTPGLLCLHAERERIFFADDHILARVSPNPLIDLSQGEGPSKFRALSRYMESARWVRSLDLDAILPGHGPAFRGHRELLDGLFAFYAVRQEKLLTRLRSAPASVHELLPTLFPLRRGGWLVLMLSEVLANLEVLEDAGRVARLEGPVTRYQAVDAPNRVVSSPENQS